MKNFQTATITKSLASARLLAFTLLLMGTLCVQANTDCIETIPENTCEAIANVTITLNNFSDWSVKFREVRSNGTKGSWSSELKRGSKNWTFSNIKAVEVHWKDGLAWKKFGQFATNKAKMCLKANGKVISLKGIKISETDC